MRFMAMASVLVGFLADGAEAHRAGDKSLDDFLGRLDFVERNRRVGFLEIQQAANACSDAALRH